jgi:hypothetical protein
MKIEAHIVRMSVYGAIEIKFTEEVIITGD